MFCRQCGSQIPDQASICTHCGVATISTARNRTTYVLLGALVGFFGFPGVHNLYAGETAKGITQLLLSVLSCWILWIPMYIWTVVEVCTVTTDADGRPLIG